MNHGQHSVIVWCTMMAVTLAAPIPQYTIPLDYQNPMRINPMDANDFNKNNNYGQFARSADTATFNNTAAVPATPPQEPPPMPPATVRPSIPEESSSASQNKDVNEKSTQLQRMIQQLYMAQGQVQLEANEIHRAQTIAASAQQNLEDSANNVRVITAALRAAQETVANAALRAQTAQLQLAAHDQLLFTARQKVDALSAQMVSLQAEVGIRSEAPMSIDLPALLNQLKQPLKPDDQPKPVGEPVAADPAHPLQIHSADYHALRRSVDAPAKTHVGGGLNAHDIHELLRWVRAQKVEALAKEAVDDSEEARMHERDASQKYVNEFIENIRHLNGMAGSG